MQLPIHATSKESLSEYTAAVDKRHDPKKAGQLKPSHLSFKIKDKKYIKGTVQVYTWVT